MEDFIKMCYTRTLRVNEENIIDIIIDSSILRMMRIRETCLLYLYNHALCPSNALGACRVAKLFDCDRLLRLSKRMVQSDFCEVSKSKYFLDLNFEELHSIVSRFDLSVNSEKVLFAAIIKWTNYDVEKRRVHIQSLLEHVRFCSLPAYFIKSFFDSDCTGEGYR